MSDGDWDPLVDRRNENPPTPQCSYRIKRDLQTLWKHPPHGVWVVPDSSDYQVMHALITGPSATPYCDAFFYFILRIPYCYPVHPPKVRLMTTGGGKVRFNPNLYENGKVCLSILGTWPGPSWSSAQTLESVLVSIQSLLSDNPYFNEPGYDVVKYFFFTNTPGEAGRRCQEVRNEFIMHETIRVAVCGMLENNTGLSIPSHLTDIMQRRFLECYEYFESTAINNIHMSGDVMEDPLYHKTIRCEYSSMLLRLQDIRSKLTSSQNNL